MNFRKIIWLPNSPLITCTKDVLPYPILHCQVPKYASVNGDKSSDELLAPIWKPGRKTKVGEGEYRSH